MQFFTAFSNHPFIHKHGPKLALGVALILLLSLLISAGLSIRSQAQIKVENYTPKPLQAVNKNKRPSYKIRDVVAANLFGDPSPKKEVTNAPKTTLDLTLHGILSASDIKLARAIISSSKNKKAQLYSIDDKIKGAGASIKEIRPQEVILNRNGSIESLALKKTESKGELLTFRSSAETVKTTKKTSRRKSQTAREETSSRKIKKPNFSGLDRKKNDTDST